MMQSSSSSHAYTMISMEQICYYCKHCYNKSSLGFETQCSKDDKKVETYHSCSDWKSKDED